MFQQSRPSMKAPGPKGSQLIGCLLDVRRDCLDFARKAAAEYGDIVSFRMGFKTLFLISSPQAAQHVLIKNSASYKKGIGLSDARVMLGNGLLTSDGPVWRQERKLLQPAFCSEYLNFFIQCIHEATTQTIDELRRDADNCSAIDVNDHLVALAIDIMGRTLFGLDLRPQARRIHASLSLLGDWAIRRMSAIFKLPPSCFFREGKIQNAFREICAIADEIVDERMKHSTPHREDTLSLLIEQRTSRQQIRDEVITLLLAGHDTVAAALVWFFYLLSRHPTIQDAIQGELDHFMPFGAMANGDTEKLALTQAAIKETLRLYPPVWMLPRRALNEDSLDSLPISKGSDVLVCIYTLHRNPNYWSEPDKFRPERFLGADSPRNDGRYMPFGAGPRTCIGNRLALLELTIAAARILQHFSLNAVTEQPMNATAALTLRPKHGFQLIIQSRNAVCASQEKRKISVRL